MPKQDLDLAKEFCANVFPTHRMDEMLDAIVKNSLIAHSDGEFTKVGHHAIVAVIEFDEIEPELAKYEIMTIPSPNIPSMYQFAGFIGGLIARMAPQKIMIGTWLVGEAWMVDTNAATPTQVQAEDHPDREEIISVTGVSLDRRRNHAVIRFHRNSKSQIRTHPENAETFYVNSSIKAYSKNTEYLITEYFEAVVKIFQ